MAMRSKKIEIVEWLERYEVSSKGREPKPDDELRAGPLQFIRLKVYGHSQGTGFRRLKSVAGDKTMEVFGYFCKFLEIAGDQKRGQRGVLLNEKNQPATAEDLAFILDVPIKQVENAIGILSDKRVGWLKNTNSTNSTNTTNQPSIRKFPEISGNADNVLQIFNHWNTHKGKSISKLKDGKLVKITWHSHKPKPDGTVSEDIKQAINKALKNYSKDNICGAIDNYAKVLFGRDFFWTHSWSLAVFLTVGEENHRQAPRKWYRFLPDNFIEANFLDRSPNKPETIVKFEDDKPSLGFMKNQLMELEKIPDGKRTAKDREQIENLQKTLEAVK